MSFGIHDINKIAENENIVRCNNCDTYFYEEIIDERSDNSLKLFFDKDHFLKGCPECETDNFLIDIKTHQEQEHF